MSIFINNGQLGQLKIKTRVDDSTVLIGDYEVSLEDFLTTARYVLTNTDLRGFNDPRLEFVRQVSETVIKDGYMPGKKRLVFQS